MAIDGVITCMVTSALFFFVSYIIWKKQQLTFIAGFDEETFKGDKSKLAKAVGMLLLICGLLILMLPIGIEVVGNVAGVLISIAIIVSIIIVVFYINRLNKD